ncbi:hypothetical protein GMSM_43510 [Geomonas sp. Red276]
MANYKEDTETNPTLFTLIRKTDATGVSGTGRVLDGVIFHTGQVVTCWRTDINGTDGFTSISVYPSYQAFLHVHVLAHPEGTNEVVFLSGEALPGING